MAPSSMVMQFEVEVSADVARERIATAITRVGGRLTKLEPTMLAAEVGDADGAQFRGVWATAPIDLPASMIVGFFPASQTRCGVHLTMMDRLTGVRWGTRSKYAATFQQWADALRMAASGLSGAADEPRPLPLAAPTTERQSRRDVIADNVKTGDWALTDNGAQRVVSIHGDDLQPSMIGFVLAGGATLVVRRADMLIVDDDARHAWTTTQRRQMTRSCQGGDHARCTGRGTRQGGSEYVPCVCSCHR